MKYIKIVAVSVLSMSIAACSVLGPSNASHMTTGKEYPATSPEQVSVIYQEPDQPFSVIGLLEARGSGITKEIQKNRAMKALKDEAASIGATAVLITSTHTATVQGVDKDLVGEETVLTGKAIHME